MDLLSKLVGATGVSSGKQADIKSPQQRLICIKKLQGQLQQIWRRSNSPKQDFPVESVLACFEEMKKTLKDEVQAPVAHLYAQHMSIFQTYSFLSQVTSQYNSGAIVQKALEIFKILIYCEEVEFLRENTFADALLDLIGSFSITGSLLVSVNVEERIVEALFAIASKLRLQPNLLPTWFRLNATTEGRIFTPHTRQDKDVIHS